MAHILALFLTILFLLGDARAAITVVMVDPAAQKVPVARFASARITWTVTRTLARGVPAGTSVRSARGEFRVNVDSTGRERVIETVERPLAQNLPVNADDPSATLVFRETVRIPARVLFRAAEEGAAQVRYVRSFDDGFGSATAALALDITGSAAAGFGVTRLALDFVGEEGEAWVLAVVPPEAELAPRAHLSFSGSGQLRAAWELAEPPSTRGEPVFRPLAQVRRFLGAGGEVEITGPVLPTMRPGTYLVRLRITAPAVDFDLPVLRYVVSATPDGGVPMAAPVPEAAVHSPAPDSLIGPDLVFSWAPVAGARVYRIELWSHDGGADLAGALVSGLAVPADLTRVTLPATTRSHLRPGRHYRWRVRALDGQGGLLAQSAYRRVRTAFGEDGRP